MKPPDHIQEIARRLAAAYISYQMGISIGYTLKRHIDEDHIGEYWIALAEKVCADMREAADRRYSHLAEIINPKYKGPIQ